MQRPSNVQPNRPRGGGDGYPYGLPQPAGAITYQLNGAQVGRGNTLNVEGSTVTFKPGPDKGTYVISSGSGGVTDVTASLPLTSSGGPTPNIAINQPSSSRIWYSDGGGNLTGDANHTINPANGNTDLRAISGFAEGDAFIDASGVSLRQKDLGYTHTFNVDVNQWTFNNGNEIASLVLQHNGVNPASLYLGESAGNLDVETSISGRNTGIGYFSGSSMTTGSDNSFFGQASGFAVTTGNTNSFFGSSSGRFTTTGVQNVFIGEEAGYTNISGGNNVFVGYQSGLYNTANVNVFVGSSTGTNNTAGTRGAFFGHGAGYSNITGNDNTFIGYSAGFSTTSGSNVFVGASSGLSNINGTRNVHIGTFSGSTGDASDNVFIGDHAGNDNAIGTDNIAIGSNTMTGSISSFSSIFIGTNASEAIGGVVDSIGIGYNVTLTSSNQLLFGSATHPIYRASIGDYTGAQNGTYLGIDDIGKQIVTVVDGIFGIADTTPNVWLQIDTPNHVIAIGDLSSAFNDTAFVVDDVNQVMTSFSNEWKIRTPVTNSIWANVDTGAGVISLGDLSGVQNSVSFVVNDNGKLISADSKDGITRLGDLTGFTLGAQIEIVNSTGTGTIARHGGIIDDRIDIQAYGTTRNVTNRDYFLRVGTSSVGATTINLPTGTNSPEGQTFVIWDNGGASSGNNITVDAGGGSIIRGRHDGSATSAQTLVIAQDGQCVTLKKYSSSGWAIESET